MVLCLKCKQDTITDYDYCANNTTVCGNCTKKELTKEEIIDNAIKDMFGDPVSDIAKIMAETFGKKVRTEDEIIKEFEKRFANPTAKYLGNDFADYPKANIKDATDFLRQSLRQYRQSIEEEMIKSFREGKICAYCGQAKEPNLTELCNKCLEEN